MCVFIIIFTVRNSSCEKVMFSQACVKNSAHRGACMAGGVCGRVVCMVGMCVAEGHGWWGCVHGRGCVWQVGMHGRGCVWQGGACMAGGIRGKRDGHCSRRYASYWNAFLFVLI